MSNLIARICEPLLRLLWPAQGRHRSPRHLPLPSSAPALTPPLVAFPSEPVPCTLDTSLVRPYLLAHEAQHAREEARLRRARRRALWFAVHGVDIGPRLIHGVWVVA